MPKKSTTIEIFARGLMVGSRGVLVCREAGGSATALPGGRIEPGESAQAALARELNAQLGIRVSVGSYMGTIEHAYQLDDGLRHELVLVFEISHGVTARRAQVQSVEQSREFLWRPVHMLADANLQPRMLPKLVQTWSLGKSAPWTSDMTPVK